MKLSEILGITYDNINKYKIHFSTGGKNGLESLNHFYSNTFKEYQERQTKRVFEREFIISLIKSAKDEWMFAGVYRRMSIGSEIFGNENIHRYETQLTNVSKELIGELLINFSKKDRNAYRFLETLNSDYDVLRTLNVSLSEEEFQLEVQNGIQIKFDSDIIKGKNKILVNASSSWLRDRNISYTAILSANFKCENNREHKTFISDKTREQFVEAHHLIPMQFQDDFNLSLDVPENIISLCPNCHRAFHHADNETKKELVLKFHKNRDHKLTIRGIAITLDNLLKHYKLPN